MNENINAMIHLLYISIILNFNKYCRKKTYARAFRPGKREREREREGVNVHNQIAFAFWLN